MVRLSLLLFVAFTAFTLMKNIRELSLILFNREKHSPLHSHNHIHLFTATTMELTWMIRGSVFLCGGNAMIVKSNTKITLVVKNHGRVIAACIYFLLSPHNNKEKIFDRTQLLDLNVRAVDTYRYTKALLVLRCLLKRFVSALWVCILFVRVWLNSLSRDSSALSGKKEKKKTHQSLSSCLLL